MAERYHWTPDQVNELYPGFVAALDEYIEATTGTSKIKSDKQEFKQRHQQRMASLKGTR